MPAWGGKLGTEAFIANCIFYCLFLPYWPLKPPTVPEEVDDNDEQAFEDQAEAMERIGTFESVQGKRKTKLHATPADPDSMFSKAFTVVMPPTLNLDDDTGEHDGDEMGRVESFVRTRSNRTDFSVKSTKSNRRRKSDWRGAEIMTHTDNGGTVSSDDLRHRDTPPTGTSNVAPTPNDLDPDHTVLQV